MKLVAVSWRVRLMWAVAVVLAACTAVQAWGTLIILSGRQNPAYGCTFGVPRTLFATLALVCVLSLMAGAISLGLRWLAIAGALFAVDVAGMLAWVLSDGFGHADCVLGI